MKLSGYLMRSTIVAALGGFLFGFDTAVISGTTGWLRQIFELSDVSLGFTVATALIGTIVGSLAIGRPSDILGRRRALFILATLYFISAIGSAFAWNWVSFMIFRFIGGLGVGGASVVSPMYTAEISPARFRGRLVAFVQFNVIFGILMAYCSNYIIALFELGSIEWRWMFGIEALPAAAFFALLCINPESPRWLVAKGRVDEASEVLSKVGTDTGSVEEEIKEIQISLDLEHHTLKEPFFSKIYLKPIMLAVMMAAFNQLSGINALLYYAKDIFLMAGYESKSALFQSAVVGFVMLVFTVLAMVIIDHFGRKKLMYIGSIAYIVSLIGVAYAFVTGGGILVLISLMVYLAAHGFGQGAVIWVFISEVFPNRVRARGQALGSFTHWFMAAVISLTFPPLVTYMGGYVFLIYAGFMVLQLLWVTFIMPETKRISLEKIQKEFGIE
ncbi:MAG: sugar porter family MFS transporter [Planctomycetota bacterium]|jgi:sugar porter (SP) family MFS transporter